MAKRSGKAVPPGGGDLEVVGWREWVVLPMLRIPAVKAKIDTGARTSALHAFDLDYFERDGREFVRFRVHPFQRSTKVTVEAEAEVLEYRRVRTSSGHVTVRPVIVTPIELAGRRWDIELTLANRDAMGFRMLLGRRTMRRRFVVDPGRSFLCGRPAAAGTRKKPARKHRKQKSPWRAR